MQDLLNGVLDSGLILLSIQELYPEFGTYWFESSGGRKRLSKDKLRELYD